MLCKTIIGGDEMAEDNIKMIEIKNDNMWFKGSPVILCSMRLALDTKTGDMFTSAKFLNIQPDNLQSITFDVICYDEDRKPINVIQNVTYSGLDISRNTDFGFHRKIKIPDISTRNVEYVIKSVSNSKGQTWDNEGCKHFDRKLEQKSIYTVQGDYNKQFLDLCTRSGIDGMNLVLQPEFEDDHWLCACGAFNWNDEVKCSQCRISRSWLTKNTRIETLQKRKEVQDADAQQVKELVQARAAQASDKSAERAEFEERNARILAEQKHFKALKLRKNIFITIGILIIIAGLIYALLTFVFPKFLEAEEYEKGTDLVNASQPARTTVSEADPNNRY